MHGYMFLLSIAVLYISAVEADSCSYPEKYQGKWFFRSEDTTLIRNIYPDGYGDMVLDGSRSGPNGSICQYQSEVVDDWLYFVQPPPANQPPVTSCVKMKHTPNTLIVYSRHSAPPQGIAGDKSQEEDEKPAENDPCINTKVTAFDLVFVVDSSGSICNNDIDSTGACQNWRLVLDFIVKFIDKLDIRENGTRVGFVRFAETAQNIFYLNTSYDKASIRLAVLSTTFLNTGTNTSAGLATMRKEQFTAKHGDRPDAQNIAIIITDGQATINEEMLLPEAMAAQSSGITTFAVGITSEIDEEELKSISSPPQILDRNYFLSPNFTSLNLVFDGLIQETCIVVESGGSVACNPGSLDIAFIIDISTISPLQSAPKNWKHTLDFITYVSEQLRVTRNGIIKIGFVTFSNKVNQYSYLNHYTDVQSLSKDISSLNFDHNSGVNVRNISGALRHLSDIYSRKNGARDFAPDIAILVTHGVSNMNTNRTIPDAYNLRTHGTDIYTVAVDSFSDKYEYKYISSAPNKENDTFWVLKDFTSLSKAGQLLVNSICKKYTYDATQLNPLECSKLQYYPPASMFYKHPVQTTFPCTFTSPGTYQISVKTDRQLCLQQPSSIATVTGDMVYFDSCFKEWTLQHAVLSCIGEVKAADIGDPGSTDKIQLMYRPGPNYGYYYCSRYRMLQNGVVVMEINTSVKGSGSCFKKPGAMSHIHTVTFTPVHNVASEVIQITSIIPDEGILSGGTPVTIYGNFGSEVGTFALENKDGTVFLDIITWSKTKVTAVTKRNNNQNGGDYKLSLFLPGNRIIKSQTTFTYLPDPIITRVYPRTTILAGGVNLTVIGNHFDPVSEAVLYVDLEVRQDSTVKQVITFVSRDVMRVNNTMMVFKTPEITLPSLRQKRDDDNKLVVNSDDLKFTAGIRLDKDEKYRNLSVQLPRQAAVTVYRNPQFEKFTETYMFDLKENIHIHVKGSGLSPDLDSGAYTLSLGEDGCELADITENSIHCRPPNVQPQAKVGSLPTLEVRVGKLHFRIGSVEYTKEKQLVTIATSTAIAAVLLIALVMTTFVCNKLKKNKQEIEKYQTMSNSNGQMENGSRY